MNSFGTEVGGRARRRGRPALSLAAGGTLLLLAICAAGGGSARVDPASLLYLRPIVAVLLAGLILLPVRDAGALRTPLWLLAAWAATIAVQLVPLPPSLWQALPGHGRFGEVSTLTGEASPWRPISLTPMLTWNALLALLPAWAGLVAASRLGERALASVPAALLVVAGVSVLFGALQIAAGSGYLYAVTSPGLPVGLFANRNHQAAFLAATLPLAAVWAWPRGDRPFDRLRPWLALGGALLLVVFLTVTGSRAGLALGGVGLVVALLLAPPLALPIRGGRRAHRGPRWWRLVPLALALGAVLLAVTLGRSLATERLVALTGTTAEQRTQALPTLLAMVDDFFPIGSGFGSFDPVFRVFEPDALLHRSVFNHAHNDLVEVALTGGAPALIVLGVFLVWFGRQTIAALRSSDRTRIAAAVSVAILLAASMVDYPLRTPLLGLVTALLVGAVVRGSRLVPADPRG